MCRYRLERAKEDLQAARVNHSSGVFKASINRSYYAIFHSIRAVNILDGFDASNGVIDLRERDTNDTKADTNDTKVDTDDTNDTYEKAILNIIQKDSSVTQKNIGKKLGISITTVKRIMRSLQKSGKMQREGSSRNGSWVIINSKE